MKKKKVIVISIATLLLVISIVTFSYAYWRLTYQATSINKIVSSCFSMELTNEKNNITLESAYPISDEKGKALTPYSFTITNTCDLFASYTINLEMLEGTTLNSKYVKTMINSEAITNLNTLETTDTSIEGATESRVLFKGSLGAGDSTDYTLRIWMDSETPFNEDSMNKVFQSKITVTAEVSTYSPVENGFTNLAEALLVNEYQTTSLSVARDKIAGKQEVDFSKTAPIIIWNEEFDATDLSLSITKASEESIGNNGITNATTKMVLGTSYTYNSETGYYKLADTAYYNPIEIDFNEKDYYICTAGITTTSSSTVTYFNNYSCTKLHKIEELTSVEDSTLTLVNGDIIATKKYNFNVSRYKSVESESDKSDKGLYEAKDDYGNSYYYRGNVTNNYVKFASRYWRIIRINGDGSVRLLYAGKTPESSGTELTIATTKYNEQRSEPTYVGYMYSNIIDTSYEDTISNDVDSLLKQKIDTWYKTNIEDAGYSKYIADSGFCNDRSLASDNTGDGYNTETYFGARERMKNYMPSFICPNKNNDLFTLAENNIGNGKLTYPVGTITADELAYSGYVNGYLNSLAYTYSSVTYWTMTPAAYLDSNSVASVWFLGETADFASNVVSNNRKARPVINLKADTEITGGIGTKNDPFIIK